MTELTANVFLCEFSHSEAREKVLDGQSWNIEGYLLVLQPWPPSLSWKEINLDLCPIWIQIHRLPTERSNALTARHIDEAIGTMLELDDNIEKQVWCVPFIRVKVLLNTSSLIPSGYMLHRGEMAPVRTLLKFERLTGFCYACGLLGHMQSSCVRGKERREDPEYGPWMKVEGYTLRGNFHQSTSRDISSNSTGNRLALLSPPPPCAPVPAREECPPVPPLISGLETKADVAYQQEDISKKQHESALAVQMAIQVVGLIDEERDGTEPSLGCQKVMMLHGDPGHSKITACNANT